MAGFWEKDQIKTTLSNEDHCADRPSAVATQPYKCFKLFFQPALQSSRPRPICTDSVDLLDKENSVDFLKHWFF